MLVPEEPPLPIPEATEHVEAETNGDADVSMQDAEPTNGHATSPENSDSDEGPVRVLRRSNVDRKRKRDEELARKEQEKKDKADAKASKQSAQLKKVLANIEKKKDGIRECEDDIARYDGDLREANCQRTKALGRDRFCNRYYWFERNGMPFGGMPDSSTADYGYANGRLWVQGPDDMERNGFIERDDAEMTAYRLQFGMTVPERRDLEEGPTQLARAWDWGYYDDRKHSTN